jgi:hypothetical protein
LFCFSCEWDVLRSLKVGIQVLHRAQGRDNWSGSMADVELL